ncbi:MAG: UPF0755 protein [Gammaproteobacteria bacterium]|jgi:UPF0755 protein
MLLKLFKKLFLTGLSLLILFTTILGVKLYIFQHESLNLASKDQTFLIKSGSNIKSIAENLTQQKVINDPWLFILLARLRGLETKVRAGEFHLEKAKTPDKLLDLFSRGVSVQYRFTVIEGWTFRQFLTELQKVDELDHRINHLSDQDIMTTLGFEGQHPEGLFFPDTYRFPKGTSDVDFLHRSYRLMNKHLNREWKSRDNDLPLNSPYEALILASIIERETGVPEERPLIAGVFVNRLRKNMRLQTDPTVIYGLGDEFDGNIRFKDLRTDTPYNTYTRKGLTPTPIALPGLKSIQAALHPEKTKAIYFVAKGDGSHYFSETLEEHNRAVRKYQLK